MTLRFCEDSTTATDIPKTATLALAYLDGRYANVRPMRAWLGPKARIVTVTVFGDLNATVADCENGDLTPQTAAKWAAAKRATHKGFPTIYCLDSKHADVIAACKARGLTLHRHYELFVADYDGQRTLPAYAVGKQFANPTLTGHHYDKSVVRAYWRGVDPPIRRVLAPLPPKTVPVPAATAAPTQGEDVKKIKGLLNGVVTWIKTHPKQVKHDVAVLAAVLAAQPAIHALIHGQQVTAAALVGAVVVAVSAAARRLIG